MKIISWNLNGLRAAWNHGLASFLQLYDADIYAFQETKMNEPFPEIELEGYRAYWSFGERRGYSGTVVLTRYLPKRVHYKLANPYFDTEGRVITLEFEKFFLVNCYVPNPRSRQSRRDYRAAWDSYLEEYLVALQKEKPAIVCGDFNATLDDRDIYEESNWQLRGKSGFQEPERENLVRLEENGLFDSFRYLHPEETRQFTWWSNRLNKRDQNRGWRLDYFFLSESLEPVLQESTMLTQIYGSDHCPIVLQLALTPEDARCPESTSSKLRYTYTDVIAMEQQGIPIPDIKYIDLKWLWESVDWEQAEAHLQVLQTIVAKSAYTKSWSLIEKWQHRLVESLDARLLAVRYVCNTAAAKGIDRIRWTTPEDKMTAALSLTAKGYSALPARMIVLEGKRGKQRRIHVETYYDRAMQTLYAYALDPVAESWGERKSFAFRKGRSMYDVNEYIISAFSGLNAPEWVLIADVRKCYESISHDWIMQNIPLPKGILHQFLKAGYIYGGKEFPMEVGIGIGCSISPIIANMTLDGLQKHIFNHLYPDGEIDYANGNLIRYADDIIVAVRDYATGVRVQGIIQNFLDVRGLELSKEKSKIMHISEGFSLMSRSYFKRGDQLFSKPSDDAIRQFMGEMKNTIENYTGSQQSLIETLNRKLDGWATYHKVTEADIAFRQMDTYISALLLQLSEQKHPQWNRQKILNHYWYIDHEGRHCYALPEKKEVRVKFLADTLFYPYNPVKTNFNPYLEQEYYEFRTKQRKILSATGVYRSIWNRQQGKCLYCGREILRDEDKELIDADESQTSVAKRNAYIHRRCMMNSYEYVELEDYPSSLNDLMALLRKLDNGKKSTAQPYYALSEFFRTCSQNSVTLSFGKLETIMGEPLPEAAKEEEFWYRTGFDCISQCWLENGYEIRRLHLDERHRVVFRLTDENKQTASVDIPPALKYGRVPLEAKYEIENHLKYVMKKYGL